MIKSMTGFGKASLKIKDGAIDVEIRSVNHKYLEITSKLSNGISVLEDKTREAIQKKICRGKINVFITFEGRDISGKDAVIDEKLSRKYVNTIRGLKNKLLLKGDIDIKDIISLPGVVDYREAKKDYTKLWRIIQKVLFSALRDLEKERLKEGYELKKELLKRITIIEAALKVIDKRSSVNIGNYRSRLTSTIANLTNSESFDKTRLETEVALFAKNCDITEEITRLKSHLTGLKDLINKTSDEVGKKLDFISQELQREINTIGSKSSDFKISQRVIEIKGEIEKIREQAKNIE